PIAAWVLHQFGVWSARAVVGLMDEHVVYGEHMHAVAEHRADPPAPFRAVGVVAVSAPDGALDRLQGVHFAPQCLPSRMARAEFSCTATSSMRSWRRFESTGAFEAASAASRARLSCHCAII